MRLSLKQHVFFSYCPVLTGCCWSVILLTTRLIKSRPDGCVSCLCRRPSSRVTSTVRYTGGGSHPFSFASIMSGVHEGESGANSTEITDLADVDHLD